MRPLAKRWYAPLLKHPQSTAFFVHEFFPKAKFILEKEENIPGKMIRHIRFELDGKIILRGRSEVDLVKSAPLLVERLRKTNQPLGLIISSFHVRRTRVRSTTRTREYRFTGDLYAKLFERYYPLKLSKEKLLKKLI